MDICIITPMYPNISDATSLAFVQQLAWTMADHGVNVNVICPFPIHKLRFNLEIPLHITEKSFNGNFVQVYFPRNLYLGQVWIGSYNTAGITTKLFSKSVDSVISNLPKIPDIFYGHFITPSGIVASMMGKKYNKPSFIAYGESSPWTIKQYGYKKVKEHLNNINGIIAVSSYNKEELISTGIVNKEKVEVFPNGYRSVRFMPRDKNVSRERFNIPQNKFVVAFVGHFIERKGIYILEKVINSLVDVYIICAGKGPLRPKGNKVLYADSVHPDELSYFYSAADVFVLPTLNEGCCNAIIEAMACGLPIISSNLPFNDDILDSSNSIKVNPLDCNALAEAILKIKSNAQLRKNLSIGSLAKASTLTLDNRVNNILDYIRTKI